MDEIEYDTFARLSDPRMLSSPSSGHERFRMPEARSYGCQGTAMVLNMKQGEW